jgi:hypothetical protein
MVFACLLARRTQRWRPKRGRIKLLFEAHLLRLAYPNMAAVWNSTPEVVRDALNRLVRESPETANDVVSVGIPILLDSGEILRGINVIVPPTRRPRPSPPRSWRPGSATAGSTSASPTAPAGSTASRRSATRSPPSPRSTKTAPAASSATAASGTRWTSSSRGRWSGGSWGRRRGDRGSSGEGGHRTLVDRQGGAVRFSPRHAEHLARRPWLCETPGSRNDQPATGKSPKYIYSEKIM